MPENATLLVVDDDLLVQEATAEMLRRRGHEVLVAGSAEEALKLLASGAAVDLVVTDVRMPLKDGFTLAVEARQMRPNLPFVFITGYMLSPERDAALGPVVWKPFKSSELNEVIQKTLRTRGGAPR